VLKHATILWLLLAAQCTHCYCNSAKPRKSKTVNNYRRQLQCQVSSTTLLHRKTTTRITACFSSRCGFCAALIITSLSCQSTNHTNLHLSNKIQQSPDMPQRMTHISEPYRLSPWQTLLRYLPIQKCESTLVLKVEWKKVILFKFWYLLRAFWEICMLRYTKILHKNVIIEHNYT